jgi:hypothetical protein
VHKRKEKQGRRSHGTKIFEVHPRGKVTEEAAYRQHAPNQKCKTE